MQNFDVTISNSKYSIANMPNALGQHKASQFDNTLFQFCQQTEVMGVEPNKMGENLILMRMMMLVAMFVQLRKRNSIDGIISAGR